MTHGPPLEHLTQRLQACPDVFLSDEVEAGPIAADVIRQLAGDPLRQVNVQALTVGRSDRAVRVMLVTCWLLAEEAFARQPDLVAPAVQLLKTDLNALADVISAEDCISDAGRREELVRFVLNALDLRPEGETRAQAADRLATLDSVARLAVVREAQVAEERARRIREAIARKARAEAAAKAPRE
ncbi:MAG: hypothetical protein Rubg2KO_37560 [Rubricoccaceae bacterium]